MWLDTFFKIREQGTSISPHYAHYGVNCKRAAFSSQCLECKTGHTEPTFVMCVVPPLGIG